MACLHTCVINDGQQMRSKVRLRSTLLRTDLTTAMVGVNTFITGFVQSVPRQFFGQSHSSAVWRKSTMRRSRSLAPCVPSRQRLSKLWKTTYYQKAVLREFTDWSSRPLNWTQTRLMNQQFIIEISMSGGGSSKYEPSEDDRAETTSSFPMELTLAQQLLMKQYEEQIERMTVAECRKLAVEIARQMMVKGRFLLFIFLISNLILRSFVIPFIPYCSSEVV